MSVSQKNNTIKRKKNTPILPDIFHVLSNVYSVRIFYAFIDHKTLTGSEIAQTLKVALPTATKHLNRMEESGIISKKKTNGKIYFSINHHDPCVATITDAFLKMRTE